MNLKYEMRGFMSDVDECPRQDRPAVFTLHPRTLAPASAQRMLQLPWVLLLLQYFVKIVNWMPLY